MSSIYNFYAGPAVIYEEVLREAQEEFMNFADTGMSVLTVSHRSKAFDAVMVEAEANMKELMGLGDDYRVLFLQGVLQITNDAHSLIEQLHGFMIKHDKFLLQKRQSLFVTDQKINTYT